MMNTTNHTYLFKSARMLVAVLLLVTVLSSCEMILGKRGKDENTGPGTLDEEPAAVMLGSASRHITEIAPTMPLESFDIPVTAYLVYAPPAVAEPLGEFHQFGFAVLLLDSTGQPVPLHELLYYQLSLAQATSKTSSGHTIVTPGSLAVPWTHQKQAGIWVNATTDYSTGRVFIPVGRWDTGILSNQVFFFLVPQGYTFELRHYRHEDPYYNPSVDKTALSDPVLLPSPVTTEALDSWDSGINWRFVTFIGELQGRTSLYDGTPPEAGLAQSPVHAFSPQRFSLQAVPESTLMIRSDGTTNLLVNHEFTYEGSDQDLLFYIKQSGHAGRLIPMALRPTNLVRDSTEIQGTWYDLGDGPRLDVNGEGIVKLDDESKSSLLVTRSATGFNPVILSYDSSYNPGTREFSTSAGSLEYLPDQDLIIRYEGSHNIVRGRYVRGIQTSTTVTGTLVDLLGNAGEDAARRASRVLSRVGPTGRSLGGIGNFGIRLVVSTLTKGGYEGEVLVDEDTGRISIEGIPVNDTIELTPILDDGEGLEVSYPPVTVTVNREDEDIGSVFITDTGYLFKTRISAPRYMFSDENYDVTITLENQGNVVTPPSTVYLSSESLQLDGASTIVKIFPTIVAKGRNSITVPVRIIAHSEARKDHRITITIPDDTVGEWTDSVSLRSHKSTRYLAIKARNSSNTSPYSPFVLIDSEGSVSILQHGWTSMYGQNLALPLDIPGYFVGMTGAAAENEYSYDIGWYSSPWTFPDGNLEALGRILNEDSGPGADDSFTRARTLALDAAPIKAYLQLQDFDFYRFNFE